MTSIVTTRRNSRRFLCLAIAAAAALAALAAATPLPQEPAKQGPDGSLIERGRYLATAGNCVSCHTRPGGAPFSGGVAFHTPFGTLYSTNITPDKNSGIGKWTEEDLRHAMQEGIDREGRHLFPAFPYTYFTKIYDADIAAIYAYLRSLPPTNYVPPSNGALFSMRWPMAIWNSLFFSPGRFKPDSTRSAEWNRGAYLLESLGHCGACHTPRNVFMAEESDRKYAGGAMLGQVSIAKVGRWSAVNLTPTKEGLASWSLSDLEKYLASGFSPRAGTFGPMNEVIVNSLALLTKDDVHAVATYLHDLPLQPYAAPAAIERDLLRDGAQVYKDHCEKCHMVSGRGGMFGGPPLAGSAIVQNEDPASLINIILYGPNIPSTISLGAWESMQAYSHVMSDSDVAAVATYVRNSWSNIAAPVDAEMVGGQR